MIKEGLKGRDFFPHFVFVLCRLKDVAAFCLSHWTVGGSAHIQDVLCTGPVPSLGRQRQTRVCINGFSSLALLSIKKRT